LQQRFRVEDYDLAATLDSGQAFRWKHYAGSWTSVIGDRWVRLRQDNDDILAETALPNTDWTWLEDYLQLDVDLRQVLEELPTHPALNQAIAHHRGLRLLRQEPWECLISFILSSTKQIPHIKQIVEQLCLQLGDCAITPAGQPKAHCFPTASRIAALQEAELRAMRMGFRAPYILAAAEAIASGRLNLNDLKHVSLAEARATLMVLPGVGRKIADCVLLFSLGFTEAFPVDVWVMRALQSAWFPGKAMKLPALVAFSESHFGRYGGYAQQYLFHHARTASSRFQKKSPHEDQG